MFVWLSQAIQKLLRNDLKQQAADEAARKELEIEAVRKPQQENEGSRKKVSERKRVESAVATQQRKLEDDRRKLVEETAEQTRLSQGRRKQAELAEQQRQLDGARQRRATVPSTLPSPAGACTNFSSSAVKIPRRELDLQTKSWENKISSGATSTVYKGAWRGINVAVKIFRADHGDKAYQMLERELSILVHIRHDRVVNFMGVCDDLHNTDGGNVALITQLMVRGSLYFVLHHQSATAISYRPRSLEMRLQLGRDIAEAMRFLHASRIFHRDLKSGNVLVDDDGRAKVADFGMSSFNRESVSRVTAALGNVPIL